MRSCLWKCTGHATHRAIAPSWARGWEEFLRQDVEIDVRLPVESLKQHEAFCGPNSLSLVAKYWGRDIPQETIAESIWDHGTALGHLWQWAEGADFEPHVLSATLDNVRRLLDLGIPVIIEEC